MIRVEHPICCDKCNTALILPNASIITVLEHAREEGWSVDGFAHHLCPDCVKGIEPMGKCPCPECQEEQDKEIPEHKGIRLIELKIALRTINQIYERKEKELQEEKIKMISSVTSLISRHEND